MTSLVGLESWRTFLGLSPGLHFGLVFVVGVVFMVAGILIPFLFLIHHVERKFGADFQARIGPSMTGPSGFFQGTADFLKLISKKGKVSSFSHDWMEWLALGILLSSLASFPVSGGLIFVNPEMGAWSAVLIIFLFSFVRLFSGARPDSLASFTIGSRSGFRFFSAVLPFCFALVCAGVAARGWAWTDFISSQGAMAHRWIALRSPFHFLSFVVFLSSGLVLMGCPPFDDNKIPDDIFHGSSSGPAGRSILLRTSISSFSVFFVCLISSTVFLGGWNTPQWVQGILLGHVRALVILEVLISLMKVAVLMIVVFWISRTNPRARTDQISDLSWRVLAPLSGLSLIGVLFWEKGVKFL